MDTDRHTGKTMGRHRKKTAVYKPRRETSETTLLTLGSWTSCPQNCEKIHFSC